MYSQFVQNISSKISHVLLKVSFENMCVQCCLEDTDCFTGSDIVWKCIPGFCCGYGERSPVTPVLFIDILTSSRPIQMNTTVTSAMPLLQNAL